MVDAIRRAHEWGRQAQTTKVDGDKRLYDDIVDPPFFIIGFSSEDDGRKWGVYIVFTESLDESYVFELGEDASRQLSAHLQNAPHQQKNMIANDKRMGGFK